MARPIEFNREAVLEKSMRVFWRYGYASTSIQRLSTQMALHPGSLYGAFKNKRQLFLEALDLYFERSSEQLREQLASGGSPLEGIRRFFSRLVEQMLDEESIKGCLMINTATELAEEGDDEVIRKRLDQMFKSHEQQFYQALVDAQSCGELAKDKRLDELARYLLVGVRGLRVYSQTRPTRQELEGVVRQLLSVLT
ncbi:MAG: TetR/AcrR family transcriptional regulator [Sedimenticola sp.]|nr:TetR/AcrR family transcriptional regulator [Sedimenticola sp.]MCW8920220.1 TetR/AcrR family transcriptional regulator [Sedimenticola sp.]MCW8949724.1 TetR/AcrR family transcriptional regulator [Sedimenticola sp.]MCW8974283.1 TetR/AcrR family transcriptional regulator [Sedimenticola sp.]MCW9021365.1 TetR/AcrR family transcriptional regulator [Sedimenticola sp.]